MNITISQSEHRPMFGAAQLSIGSGIAFLVLLVLVHLAKPELDPSWRPISEYALGPFGWMMTLAFLDWGFIGTIVVWVAFALLTTQMMLLLPQHGGQLGPEVQVGWSSRFLVVVYAAWVMLAAWYANKVNVGEFV